MKRPLSKIFLSYVFLFLSVLGVASSAKYLVPLVFTVSNQPQYKFSFVNNNPNLERNSKKTKNMESLDIKWGAVFNYPFQSNENKEIHLHEDNLDWRWREEANKLIGETSIESCPVILEYSIENNKLISRISFTNTTKKTIDNLQYVFEINFPSHFVIENGKILTSRNRNAGEVVLTTDNYIGKLAERYEGNERGSANYIIEIGDINPNQTNNALIVLEYK